jgi:hypothetical protein
LKRKIASLLIVLCLPVWSSQAVQTSSTSAVPAILGELPAELREEGRALLAEPDVRERARKADLLGRKGTAATRAFLLSVLRQEEAAPVRRAILDRLARTPDEAVLKALAHHAASDPDAEVAIFALDRYRHHHMTDMRKLLNARLALSDKAGDANARRMLAKEDERWVSLVRGTMLPSFLQDPPPLFTVRPASDTVRVLAFGDYGNGSKNQRDVAAAMKKYQDQNALDFGITLGDNFYSKGMLSTSDPNWKSRWDDLYDPLGIQIHASLGNHDWGYADSPAAEVLYTHRSPSWRMPKTYYTFTAGPAQFFALDTNEISRAQLMWLDEQLAASGAKWKIVYGHHPIYSAGRHADSPRLIQQLLPVLKSRGVDLYIAGHDHDMQHLRSEGSVNFFVAGGAGAGLRIPSADPRTLFAQAVHGFAVLEVAPNAVTVRFVDINLAELYSHTIKKEGQAFSSDAQ